MINKTNVGDINVSCWRYEATVGAVTPSNGVGFVPNDDIPHGDNFFNIIDYPIIYYVDDLSGCLDPMIFVRALNGCLEDSIFTINIRYKIIGEDGIYPFAPSVSSNYE